MKNILTIISLLAFILGLIGGIICKIRNKPTKKALVLIGVSVVIYITAAFISEQRLEMNENVTTELANTEEPENVEYTGSSDNITDRLENVEYIGSDMPLITLADFSEERAFIQFTDYSEEDLKMAEDGVKAALSDDEDEAFKYANKYIDYEPQGGNRVALIDTQGKIIWKSERTINGQILTAVSEFRDGLAYFIFNGNEGETYNIIDSEGNVSYMKDKSEDFMILSHGGGLFLVAEHIVNFDVDEWQIGTMDKNGNIVAEYKSYEITMPSEEPLSVEKPSDPYSELQDIDDALSLLAEERQAWVEMCWDYDGEIDEEYYRMVEETEMEFQNRYDELLQRKIQLQEQYDEQLEEYQEYLMELEEYEAASQHTPETIAFDKNSVHDYQLLCEYLGENIYRVPLENGFVVLNMDSQSVISLNMRSENTAHIEQFISNFENGSATVFYSEPVDWEALKEEDDNIYWAMLPTNSYSLCLMETDGTITPITSNSWTNYALPHILNDEKEFCDGLLFVPYSGDDDIVYMDKKYYALTRDEETAMEKGFIFHTGVYYNIDGEVAIELSEYNGKNIYFCDPFYNGYALMLIQGVDQLTYFTVIDKNGKLQFEPQTGFDNVYMSKDGKYLIAVKWQNLTVYDIKGNSLVSVNSDQISSEDGLFARYEQITLQNKYDVCDGVIRFKDLYVNVEKRMVIGSDSNAGVEFSAIE